MKGQEMEVNESTLNAVLLKTKKYPQPPSRNLVKTILAFTFETQNGQRKRF